MTKIPALTYLRALAQISIIFAHIQFVVPWHDRFDLIKYVRPFFENSTFPFFILSGILLVLTQMQTPYKDFLRKKFNSVMKPYLIAIIPVILIHFFFPELFLKTDQLYYMKPSSLGVMLTSGKNSVNIAMWFFPVITTFFILSPVFKWLVQRKKILMTAMVISFFISNLTHRPPSTSEYLRSFLYFVFPFLLGLVIGLGFERYQKLLVKFRWWLLAGFFVIYCLQVQYGPLGGLDRLGTWEQMSLLRPDYSLLQKLFMTLTLLGFLLSIEWPSFIDRFLNEMSDYAFGLHLYHGYLLTAYLLIVGPFRKGYGVGTFFLQGVLILGITYLFCRTIVKLSPALGRLLFSVRKD